MRRCSALLFIISFSSLSNPLFNQARIEAGDAIERCNVELKQNVKPFSINQWFMSLSRLDKRLVVGYISLENSQQCSWSEMDTLRSLSVNLTPYQRELLDKSSIIKPFVFKGNVSHLDMKEIESLQRTYTRPFDIFRVLEDLGL